MNLHQSDIQSRLARFLERKQMPRRLEGKGGAMEDEVRALCAAVERNAPRDSERLAEWWPRFEAVLGEVCGSMWPTEKEIRDAASKVSADMPRIIGPEVEKLNPVQIAAKRMNAGEPVGDQWLWGSMACELIASREIDEATMKRYRSGAFFAQKATYGEEAALRWEAEMKARHEAAKDVWRDRQAREQRHITIPNKSAKPQWEAAE
jgi:hypothetical protein